MNTPTISPSRIIYNRAARQWEAHNGRLLGVFPAGPAGKQAAQLCALKHDHRVLWDEVERIRITYALDAQNDAIETRTIKAAQLVTGGHVLAARPYNDRAVAYVRSQSRGVGYHIEPSVWLDGYLQCDCQDYHYRAPTLRSGQRACKHILAYHLATIEQRAYEIEAFEVALEETDENGEEIFAEEYVYCQNQIFF